MPATLSAQEADSHSGTKPKLAWKVDFNTFFDNREGDDSYSKNKTFFITRLSPEIGLSLDEGRHRIMGGVSWSQPIGSDWSGYRINPVLYYKYSASRLSFSLGFTPRNEIYQKLPIYLESDSTSYFQYTFRGGTVNYVSENGFFEGVLDWRGMQSELTREAFCLMAGGEWFVADPFLSIGGFGMLNHLARTSAPTSDEHVVDNFILNPYVSTDLASLTPLKKLKLSIGLLASLNRERGVGSWLNAAGLYSELEISWWRLSLSNNLYISKYPLFRLYERFGPLLYEGEPYFASNFYDRVSLSGNLLQWRDIVDLKATLDLNFTHAGMTFCQKLLLSLNF